MCDACPRSDQIGWLGGSRRRRRSVGRVNVLAPPEVGVELGVGGARHRLSVPSGRQARHGGWGKVGPNLRTRRAALNREARDRAQVAEKQGAEPPRRAEELGTQSEAARRWAMLGATSKARERSRAMGAGERRPASCRRWPARDVSKGAQPHQESRGIEHRAQLLVASECVCRQGQPNA